MKGGKPCTVVWNDLMTTAVAPICSFIHFFRCGVLVANDRWARPRTHPTKSPSSAAAPASMTMWIVAINRANRKDPVEVIPHHVDVPGQGHAEHPCSYAVLDHVDHVECLFQVFQGGVLRPSEETV